jgi:hypothetical protein
VSVRLAGLAVDLRLQLRTSRGGLAATGELVSPSGVVSVLLRRVAAAYVAGASFKLVIYADGSGEPPRTETVPVRVPE